jgi:hypothetical protein
MLSPPNSIHVIQLILKSIFQLKTGLSNSNLSPAKGVEAKQKSEGKGRRRKHHSKKERKKFHEEEYLESYRVRRDRRHVRGARRMQ